MYWILHYIQRNIVFHAYLNSKTGVWCQRGDKSKWWVVISNMQERLLTYVARMDRTGFSSSLAYFWLVIEDFWSMYNPAEECKHTLGTVERGLNYQQEVFWGGSAMKPFDHSTRPVWSPREERRDIWKILTCAWLQNSELDKWKQATEKTVVSTSQWPLSTTTSWIELFHSTGRSTFQAHRTQE